MIEIKEAVKDNKQVTFKYFRDNELWYETEHGDLFPVPVEEIGKATFMAKDKALLFMRWIRKWNESFK